MISEKEFSDYLSNDKWNSHIDGKPTFFYVLDSYSADVALRWRAETTKERYSRDYEQFVLPIVNDRNLESFTRVDFDEVLKQIEEAKGQRNHVYNEVVKQHFKLLIYRVLDAAEKNNICTNVLWGTSYAISESEISDESEERLTKEYVKLRKSLSIAEEVKIADQLLQNPQQSGQLFGLALMFCCGLRNSEACGADFGDIHPLECDENIHCLWVYKTTESGGNVQRYGGKTANVGRVIPLPGLLKDLLIKRRQYLMQLLIAGNISMKDGPEDESVSVEERASRVVKQMPIACVNDNYTVRCSAPVLTREGTRMLRVAQISEDIVAYIDADVCTEQRTREGIKEKDPTTYLFRRNLGTHLYVLGLESSEIEYIVAHEIEDDQDKRSFFRNEEKLYAIAKKMAMRPIVNNVSATNNITLDTDVLSERNMSNTIVHIPIHSSGQQIKARIHQREPNSRLRVTIRTNDAAASGMYALFHNDEDYAQTLTMVPQYQKAYEVYLNSASKQTSKTEDASSETDPTKDEYEDIT